MLEMPPDVTSSSLLARDIPAYLGELSALLVACVEGGASVGFILPFTAGDAEAYWRTVQAAVDRRTRLLLIGEYRGRLAGTVQLDIDTPENQPHRVELRKLLVHPEHRRRGVATAMIADAERRTLALGRRLITLDTRTGDGAERLYTALGYATAGVIPGYCLDAEGRRLDSTTVMYKTL